MDSPPASPRPPTPPPRPDEPQQPSGAERRYPLRSTRADHRAASGSSHAASARRNPVRSTRATSSTPGQRGRALELAPPLAPLAAAPAPAPPSAARPPAPAPLSAAPAPAPPSAARTPAPAPPSPSRTPAPVPPSPARSTAPAPTSAAPSGATSSKSRTDDLGSRMANEEGRHIKINLEDLHKALDTLGVSDAEKNAMIKSVSNECLGVYNRALDSVKERCLSMVKAISVLEDQCVDISRVLGEIHRLPEQQTLTASLPVIHGLVTTALLRFEGLRKERLENLHAMQDKMIDLWDHLGVTIREQKDYNHMMRNTSASVEEVTADNALSAGLLSEIQSEIKRLQGRLMQQIGQKIAVLAGNLRQTHLSGHEDYELNFALIDVQEGRVDMFSADSKLKQLILNSEKVIVTRADIVDCAEAIFKRRKERGSNEEDEGATSLVERVKEWERMNKTKFFYDKGHIMEKLLKPEPLCKNHAVTPPAGAAEKGKSPSWSDSEDSGSDESGSEQDSDFVPSESEEE